MRRAWPALPLALIMVASVFTSVTGTAGSRRAAGAPVTAPGIHLHQEALDHLQPRPESFRIQAGSRDPSGKKGAGGRAVAHHAGARTIDDSRVAGRTPEARLHRTGFGAWEPTLGATTAGDIFFNGLTDAGDPIVVAS